MKIAIFDPYGGKFTSDMQQWWRDRGEEVQYSRYYDPRLAEWADVLWFDTCDNNLASATNPGSAIRDDADNYQPWDLHDQNMAGKKVIVRPIDIEVWQGAQHAARWDLVTDCIFIAPHIARLMPVVELPDYNPDMKVKMIPCAVNLDRYRFTDREPGFNIAVVSEKWTSKGTDLILQIALKLKGIDERYNIHWLGRWSDHPWEVKYFEDFIIKNELNIEFTEWIESENAVDEFLNGKNYLLHASHKEAFCYAIAEAMAKGIKPVLHRFYGADDLWWGLTWDSIDEAVAMITDDNYNSKHYRDILIDRGFTLPSMMDKINRVINN